MRLKNRFVLEPFFEGVVKILTLIKLNERSSLKSYLGGIFNEMESLKALFDNRGSCHKSQKPQAPIRNRQTRKVANAKGLNRNTNLT